MGRAHLLVASLCVVPRARTPHWLVSLQAGRRTRLLHACARTIGRMPGRGPNSHGGRGGRGGFRGGGRGGGGGGEQRWWDPVWRAERLKQMRQEGPSEQKLDKAEWFSKLQDLKASNEQEMIVRTNYGRTGGEILEEMAHQLGLHFHAYNKGRNTVLAVSKVPLPNYRADLDERHGQSQRQISLSSDTEMRVQTMLAKSLQTQGSSSGQSDSPQALSQAAQDYCSASSVGDADKEKLSSELKAHQKKLQATPTARSMRSFREQLPAFKMKDELLQAVSRNQVLVISGQTGCGKTTQLPQFILEEEIEAGRGADVEIICTQPRRISAISVASRVAAERGDDVGQSVGYQIRLEAKRSNQTRLLFCTTGVLLRRLVRDPLLKGVSHVMVDEIHERGMNEDFLLIVLRDLLPKRPDLQLVLMSATINAELFSSYFDGAPMMHIPGFTFAVKELFLEDVLQMMGYVIPFNQQTPRPAGGRRRSNERKKDPMTELYETVDIEEHYRSYSNSTRTSLLAWNPEMIDLDLVEASVEHICRREAEGAILVFLTGWDDISKLLEKLRNNPSVGHNLIIPLHGSMPTMNQREIFQRPPHGVRKIVLATNIAETSITIDDVVYVIDCGKAKETSYDALNKLACLQPTWISKAASHQRRGRAGRVQPGICYHLYPRLIYDAMPEYQLPEIIRTPLESLCLQIKSLELERIAKFLSKALQPPEALAVQNAIELLKTIGALDESEELTSLGRHLATLPLDPKVAKMLLLGATFKCIGPALTIAAALAYRDPFVIPIDRKEQADEAKRWFAGNTRSDHIGMMKAYEGYVAAKRKGQERKFCWENFLSAPTLQWIEDARSQFLGLLTDIGFIEKSLGFEAYNIHGNDMELVRAILCSGLYPNVVQCKQRGKRTAFFTKEDGKVEPHPSSVNSRVPHFPSPWLVYSEKVKTTGIYLRDSTNVSDYALLMFGGPLVPTPSGVEMLDGYLHFSASSRTMELVNELRQQLDSLLARKVENPGFDLHSEAQPVVNAVMALLCTR